MAKLTHRDYAKALYSATKNLKGQNLSVVIKSFTELLFRKGLIKQASSIITEFIAYNKKMEGIETVHVTTAKELSVKNISEIRKIFGEKTEIIEQVDDSIIGGVVVQTDNKIFDGSIKKQLNLLKQKIN